MNQLLALTLKELKLLSRDRQALALLFLMPSFFILIMSYALDGVFETGTRSRPLEILISNRDMGDSARKTLALAAQLEEIRLIERGPSGPLTRNDVEAELARGTHSFALVFGPHYSERIAGEPAPGSRPSGADDIDALALIADPTVNRQLHSMVLGTLSGIVERVRLEEQLPARLQETFGIGDEDIPPPNLGDPSAADFETLGSELAGLVSDEAMRVAPQLLLPRGLPRRSRPSATEQNVPAYAIFGVFFIVLTIAKSFLRERIDGTFTRLMSAPVRKAVLIAGKLFPYYLINLIQIALMFAVGMLAFDIHLGNLTAFLVVSLATAAAANGLGLLVAAVSRTEAQVDTLAVLLAIVLAALGGIMVPSFIMPHGLQTLSLITPHAWALNAYQDIIVRGYTVREVLYESAILMGFAVAFWAIGLWRLRLSAR